MENAGEAEIADSDGTSGGDHYVCRFEITVYHPVSVEV